MKYIEPVLLVLVLLGLVLPLVVGPYRIFFITDRDRWLRSLDKETRRKVKSGESFIVPWAPADF